MRVFFVVLLLAALSFAAGMAFDNTLCKLVAPYFMFSVGEIHHQHMTTTELGRQFTVFSNGVTMRGGRQVALMLVWGFLYLVISVVTFISFVVIVTRLIRGWDRVFADEILDCVKGSR